MALQGTIDIGFDKEAWDLMTYYSFRDELFFDSLCEVKAGETSTPGSTVHFTFTDDLAIADTPLDEKTDVTPVTTTDSNLTLTIAEFGNAVKTTKFLREMSFIPLDPVVANVIGYNAGLTLDTLARVPFNSGTNVVYAGDATATAQIVPTDVLTANIVRRQVAKLRKANVPTFGGKYASIITPDVSVDLREETGAAAWNEPAANQEAGRIWNGEIGTFAGARFIEAPRAVIQENAGAGVAPADVHNTLFMGRQAVAKGYAPAVGQRPSTVPGPVTDTLRRFVPMGWYWIGGYKIFRQESLIRVESGSGSDEGYSAT